MVRAGPARQTPFIHNRLLPSPRLARIWSVMESDVRAVDDCIAGTLKNGHGLTGEVSRYLLQGMGKRLRPVLVILCARLGTYRAEAVVPVAAATELVHMATLVHDDVIDRSPTRRGWPTVNATWNERVAILLGDHLFSRALAMAARYGGLSVVEVLSAAVEEMVRGEMEQEAHRFDPDQSEDDYLTRIGQKTARFLADCCRAGAMMGQMPESATMALCSFGYSVGMAFQIVDDILDFTGSGQELGKPVGSDLREGVVTLPVIYALAGEHRGWVRDLISARQPGEAELARLRDMLHQGGYLERAYGLAREFRQSALEALAQVPSSPMLPLLKQVAEFVVERRF